MDHLFEWINVVGAVNSPITVFLAVTVYHLKLEIKSLRRDMHDNGFVRKDIHEANIEILKDRIENLHERLADGGH